jgi:hypothetical protein
MQLAGTSSWRISEDRWPEAFDVALWFRAAERIDVAPGGVVPGPADVEPLPDPSTDPADAAELAAGWLAWWHSLIGLPPLSPPFDLARPPALLAFITPDFPAWPPGLCCGGRSPAGGGRLRTGTTPARRRGWTRACTAMRGPARR